MVRVLVKTILLVYIFIPIVGIAPLYAAPPATVERTKSAQIPLKETHIKVHTEWLTKNNIQEVAEIEKGTAHAWTEKQFEQALVSHPCKAFAATYEEKVVGYILFEMSKEGYHIKKFVVHPDFRGKDIGAQLFDSTIGELIKSRRKHVSVYVSKEDTATQELLGGLAFRKGSVVQNYRGFWEEMPAHDVVEMRHDYHPDIFTPDNAVDLMLKTHYQRLRVDPKASNEDIEQAHKIAMKRNTGNPQNQDLVTQSYERLIHPARRSYYDEVVLQTTEWSKHYLDKVTEFHGPQGLSFSTPDPESSNLHQCLGVGENAKPHVILDGFTNAMAQYEGNPKAQKAIREALAILTDAVLLRAYNEKVWATRDDPQCATAKLPGLLAEIPLNPNPRSPNYYQRLGLEPDASQRRIQAAYDQLMRQTDMGAAEKANIQEAYDALKTREARARYERDIKTHQEKAQAEHLKEAVQWTPPEPYVLVADPQQEDYYRRLGVHRNTHPKAITDAFLKALHLHRGDLEAKQRLKQAYQVLNERPLRKFYDRHRRLPITYKEMGTLDIHASPKATNHYSRLGVTLEASPVLIEYAYKKAMLEYPTYKLELTQSYKTLINPVSKARFDGKLTTPSTPPKNSWWSLLHYFQPSPKVTYHTADPYHSNYYQILGVSENTDPGLFEAAYKKAKRNHQNNPFALQKIERAYAVLSHTESKRQYDNTLRGIKDTPSSPTAYQEWTPADASPGGGLIELNEPKPMSKDPFERLGVHKGASHSEIMDAADQALEHFKDSPDMQKRIVDAFHILSDPDLKEAVEKRVESLGNAEIIFRILKNNSDFFKLVERLFEYSQTFINDPILGVMVLERLQDIAEAEILKGKPIEHFKALAGYLDFLKELYTSRPIKDGDSYYHKILTTRAWLAQTILENLVRTQADYEQAAHLFRASVNGDIVGQIFKSTTLPQNVGAEHIRPERASFLGLGNLVQTCQTFFKSLAKPSKSKTPK